MKGRVYAINRNSGMVAIETELHGFTIIELSTDAGIEMGDELSWEGDLKMGAETYNNVSTNRPVDVFVRNHLVSKNDLRRQLLM